MEESDWMIIIFNKNICLQVDYIVKATQTLQKSLGHIAHFTDGSFVAVARHLLECGCLFSIKVSLWVKSGEYQNVLMSAWNVS